MAEEEAEGKVVAKEKAGQEMRKCLNYHKNELGDEEMLLPDESMATFRASVLATAVPEELQSAEPAHVLAPVLAQDPQPAEPAHVLAPVVPEDPQPAEPASALVSVPEDLQPAEPASASVSVPEDPQPAVPASASVSVPEEPAEPVLPAAVVPASLAPSEAARSEAAEPSGVPRYVSPKEFSTPKRLIGFSFRFRKAPNPNVWQDVYKYPLTMSTAFNKDTWRDALLEIHTNARGGALQKSKWSGRSLMKHLSKCQGAFPTTCWNQFKQITLSRCLHVSSMARAKLANCQQMSD